MREQARVVRCRAICTTHDDREEQTVSLADASAG
jgi:hypothetical protein